MTVDHVNKFGLVEYNHYLYNIGRVTLPIFIFVLAFNLSRISLTKLPSICKRLVVFGIISTVPYTALGGGQYLNGVLPLNVLFTLASAVLVIYLLQKEAGNTYLNSMLRITAIGAFLVSGVCVEYFWAGTGLTVSLYYLFVYKRLAYRLFALFFCICFSLLLLDINGNLWALAALPIIALLSYLPKQNNRLPRLKYFFYIYYPAHLAVAFLILARLK